MSDEQAKLQTVLATFGREADGAEKAKDAPESPEGQGKALLDAATRTRLPRVHELLALGIDPNCSDPWGRTPMHLAVRYAYNGEADALAIVQALLAAGADLHAADQDGFTALKHAAVYDYPGLLRFLIDAGAEVNHRTPQGLTAIGMIEDCPPIRNRRKRVIKMLEQAGGVR